MSSRIRILVKDHAGRYITGSEAKRYLWDMQALDIRALPAAYPKKASPALWATLAAKAGAICWVFREPRRVPLMRSRYKRICSFYISKRKKYWYPANSIPQPAVPDGGLQGSPLQYPAPPIVTFNQVIASDLSELYQGSFTSAQWGQHTSTQQSAPPEAVVEEP